MQATHGPLLKFKSFQDLPLCCLFIILGACMLVQWPRAVLKTSAMGVDTHHAPLPVDRRTGRAYLLFWIDGMLLDTARGVCIPPEVPCGFFADCSDRGEIQFYR